MGWLEFEIAYFGAAVELFNHYDTETPTNETDCQYSL